MSSYTVKRLTGLGWLRMGDVCDAATALTRAERMAAQGNEARIYNAETGTLLLTCEPDRIPDPQCEVCHA